MTQEKIRIDTTQIYKPLPHQEDVHSATQPMKALMGGYGSGKTTMLAMEAIKLSVLNRPYPVGFFGPTHRIVKSIDLFKVEELLTAMGVKYNYQGELKQLSIPQWGAKIWFYACHDPKSLVGPTLAAAICDEPGLYPEKAWKIIDSRVREPNAELLQIIFGGTPEGMNWLYDILVTQAETEKVYLRFASTRDNTELPPDRVDAMYENFPARVAKMYLDGQFIPLAEAQVYFAYNPEKHDRKCTLQRGIPLDIGIDFNIRNMYAEVNQIIRKDVFHCLEIPAYETKELALNMYDDLRKYLPWHLYPDASGQYADSKGISDFQILHDVFNAKGLKRGEDYFMHYPSANGSVRDRTNSVNCLMENAKGEVHYFLNAERCPKIKRDYLQVSYKKNSRELDKTTNPNLTHPSDAEGYMTVRKFPVKPEWRI